MQRLWWGFLRLFFRLLYNEMAWTYDLVAWIVSLGQWKAWGRTAIPHLRGQRVLELAHGPGHLLAAMAERGLSPVGLDLSPHMGHLASRRLQGRDVPLVRARAQALPFRDGCFDSVAATFPTDFILAQTTLREVVRVLRSDGRLVVVVGARLSGKDPLSRFIWWLYQVTGQADLVPEKSTSFLARAGLFPRYTWEEIGRNQVLLVTTDKRHAG